jgi:hypothetical protein
MKIAEEMTFLIRQSLNRPHQAYSMSIYYNGSVHHTPIYRDGSDLMLMSSTFTSLIELVDYFSRKPVFSSKTLERAAIAYAEFLDKQRQYQSQGLSSNVTFLRPLSKTIELKVDALRASSFVDA